MHQLQKEREAFAEERNNLGNVALVIPTRYVRGVIMKLLQKTQIFVMNCSCEPAEPAEQTGTAESHMCRLIVTFTCLA